MQAAVTTTIMALDVGERRIGIALADSQTRLPKALKTLERSPNFVNDMKDLIDDNRTSLLVIGLPRGLDGQTTDQTRKTEAFVADFQQDIKLPIHWQDEALTSKQAEAELNKRGKPYVKGDVDALAAVY